MIRSTVISALLVLIGSGVIGPFRALAQEVDSHLVESADVEAAPLADSHETDVYQLFPRSGISDEVSKSDLSEDALSMEVLDHDTPDARSASGIDAWDASERFSRGRFLDTIPVQYPLDNSPYEGESPTGLDPEEADGDWRSSSIDRPQECLPLEDRPWIELSKTTLMAQTLPASSDGLGITSFDLRGAMKFAKYPFLFVTPRAGIHLTRGPSTTDVPSQLYDFSVDTTIFLPINDRWTIQAAAAPSLFSDLKEFQDSFRMVGRGLAFYRWSSELQLAGGFLYLGRKDIVALPAAGFIYTPTDDVKLDIMFPKPRVGYRYHHDGDRERWVYVTGELGGGTWAVQRASGDADLLTYRDLQLLLGIESKQPGALNWQLEGGYVFSREIDYDSGVGTVELPSAAIFRVVLSF